jgi:hypothetical protein
MKLVEESPGLPAQLSGAMPRYGWLGLALVAICWPLNWALPGPRTHLLFFPLWLGYTLIVNALTFRRSGSSLIARSPRDFALLFVISAPAWWLFEILNWRTGNWEYTGRELFSDLEFVIYCSICFSTVMPAIFGTAELIRSFGWIERFANRARVPPSPPVRAAFFVCGCVMLGLMLAWPIYFFPFMWLSVFLILEPLCVWLGRRSILSGLAHGDWRTVIALCLAALICGFFWEMWNIFSFPKWIYHVPFVGFWHIFEMPLLGYGGYPPFALELYVLVHLISRRPPQLQI